ncbi:TRAP transporter substrate-binding protein DctP [Acuticoccus sp.]|uniref:TRAP transporter substrate-binding protein n=1 Tax=Acuticoccus sp. TaxID=1904378 RepID=UPI003B5195E5
MTPPLNALVAVPLILAAGTAAAQEVTLRVADTFPSGHYIAQNLTQVWMDRVRELSDERVDFTYFGAGQLGKIPEMLDLVESGVVDVAYVPPSSYAERIPLTGVAELPGFFTDAATGTAAFNDLLASDLIEGEFEGYAVTPLFGALLPQYQVAVAGEPIDSAEKFQDVRLRTPGGVLELAADELGALAVPMGGPEMYTAFQRGTVDATLNAYGSMESYKLNEVLRSVSTNGSFGTFGMIYVIDDDVLAGLPQDIQDILLQAGEEAARSFADWVDGNEREVAARFAEGGITTYEIPQQVVDAWNVKLGNVADLWASRLDERGLEGSAAVEAWRASLAEARAN